MYSFSNSVRFAATLASIASFLVDPTHAGNPQSCQDIVISVDASANNLVVPSLPDLTKPGAPNAFLATAADIAAQNNTQLEGGTFNISARYCPAPSPCGEQGEVIEILVHGGSYTKEYWAGGGFSGFDGDQYSWIKYANGRNYATLSIDELGNGNSSHPDPAQVVQPLLESETIHAIVQQLHTGKVGNRQYSDVVLIGHSFGSFTSARLAQDHPKDLAALILTGYSKDLSGNVILQENFEYEPAFEVTPRFKDLPQGYFAMSNRTGRSVAFYYNGTYDPTIPVLDFETEGTVAVGEPFGTTLNPVPEYTGPVLLVSGDHDAVVCGNTTGGSCLPAANSTVAKTRSFFPNATSFEYFLANQSGHSINFHYTAPQTFKAIHDWIDSKFNVGIGNNTACPSSNVSTTANTTASPSAPKPYTAGATTTVLNLGTLCAGLLMFVLVL